MGGIAHQSCTCLHILFHQDNLLAPVARDVAHEGRTVCRGRVYRPFRELYQSGAVVLLYHHIGAVVGASGRTNEFSLQVTVPPYCLLREWRFTFFEHIALTVVEVEQQRIDLVTFDRGIHINTSATPHVIDRRQIPFLDMLPGGSIVEHLSQQVALLYGKHLHARTVGVYIAHVKAVAMTYAGTIHHVFDRIDTKASLKYLINTVAIHICHTQLVKLCRIRLLVVAAPCVVVVPVRGLAFLPVISPRHHIIMVGFVFGTVVGFHSQRGMHAIKVGNDKLCLHEGKSPAVVALHIVCPVVACVMIHAIGQLLVFHFGTVCLGTCLGIDH